MRKLLAIGSALCALSGTPVHAADVTGLPKELWGKWCATESATGGGSPRFWQYARTCRGDRDKFLTDEDMTLGPYRMNDCRAITRIDWMEDNAPVYFVTYRCKDGNNYTAKFALDKEALLNVQYYWMVKNK